MTKIPKTGYRDNTPKWYNRNNQSSNSNNLWKRDIQSFASSQYILFLNNLKVKYVLNKWCIKIALTLSSQNTKYFHCGKVSRSLILINKLINVFMLCCDMFLTINVLTIFHERFSRLKMDALVIWNHRSVQH